MKRFILQHLKYEVPFYLFLFLTVPQSLPLLKAQYSAELLSILFPLLRAQYSVELLSILFFPILAHPLSLSCRTI